MSHKGKKDRFLATLPEDGFTTYDVLTADGVHNHSENRHFSEIINTYISRRKVLVGGLGLAALKLFGCVGEHTTGEPNEKDIMESLLRPCGQTAGSPGGSPGSRPSSRPRPSVTQRQQAPPRSSTEVPP